ncbi:hypothetical protein DesfrDRAFT_1715 [Solidesulfovibrio fructosivorans JJ]]|uniref:Uncharacterized protein n=1 Tax=Solidesulfovibrio fructosivorans JJ] TaxID=596151 RepID=E1JVR6_SOLFR|nr:hypothetical protein [Solidesulfovibrio fructosivorans]EFL51554.1 hypothetical protein DesfrDRAFT_1715 [Solidesulfovibrio fructosivorans JJ]]
MTTQTPHTGRPLPAALALGFAGAGATCLLLRELLLAYCGNEAAMGAAMALLPLAIAVGAALPGRLWPDRDPADSLGPALGFLAIILPLSLLLPRLARPGAIVGGATALSPLAVSGAAIGAFVPSGLCLGLVWMLTGTVGCRQEGKNAARLPAALAGAAALGALFVQFVAIPKLTPLNASLDMGLACCVAGILCAAGSPGGRGPETWLSVMALGFVLLLPVSGLLETRLAAWQWQCPVSAVPAVPAAIGTVLGGGARAVATALTYLAVCIAAVAALAGRVTLPGLREDQSRDLAIGMAEAGAFLGLLLAYQGVAGNLFPHLPALAAAWLVGDALALYPSRDIRRGLVPNTPALCGAALGLALLSALLIL